MKKASLNESNIQGYIITVIDNKQRHLLFNVLSVILLVVMLVMSGCTASTTVGVSENPETAIEQPNGDDGSEHHEGEEETENDGSEDDHQNVDDSDDDSASEEEQQSEDAKEAPESDDSTEKVERGQAAEDLGLTFISDGVAAPDFTLPALDGAEIKLSELEGKNVILNFWTTHCIHCIAEMEYFDDIGPQYLDELTILTVDIREDESKVQDFLGEDERNFLVALDTKGEVSTFYGIRYTPTTLLIDEEGVVYYARIGAFTSKKHFEDSVKLLLGT
jgi:peroxiredoxin